MAAQFNKSDALTPRGTTLEADDGCLYYPGASGAPHLAKPNISGVGGMDECDFCSPYDSGIGMQSVLCEGVPSLGIADPVKSRLIDVQTTDTCVSVGYASFGVPDDVCVDSTLERRMEGLDVRDSPTAATKSEAPVDAQKAFVERLQDYFTPDDDGDT